MTIHLGFCYSCPLFMVFYGLLCCLHRAERMDGAKPLPSSVAICKGRGDKPKLTGVASHLLSKWFMSPFFIGDI